MMKQNDSWKCTWKTSEKIPAVGCTGISLIAKDGSYVQARTIEGSEMDLPGIYVVIPSTENFNYQSFISNLNIENTCTV